MKKYLVIAILGLSVLACESESSSSETSDSTKTESMDTPKGKEAEQDANALPRPERREVDIDAKLPDGATSVLAGLEDMAYDEAYEIDDYRSRLEFKMGEVNSTLLATAAMFEKEGDLLVAKGEVTNEGQVLAVILVADPQLDVLHGASFDAATGASEYFTDKEGSEKPAIIEKWTQDYQ